jgi:hypothetical protein
MKLPNLDAPARLAFWPEFPWDQGSDYETLGQALTEAAPAGDDESHPFMLVSG